MELKPETNFIKTGRYKYFQMKISLGIGGPKAIFEIDLQTLLPFLLASRFVTQIVLEKTLLNLKIKDQTRVIKLQKFVGQLERDSINGAPVWNIFLQTTSLTTPRRIANAVSKELFQTNNTVDSRIKVLPNPSFELPQRENRLGIKDSDWHPGYFSDKTVKLSSLLEEKEILESIEENPKRYTVLLETICKRELESIENS